MDHLPTPIDHAKHDRVHLYAPAKREVYFPEDFFNIPEAYGYHDLQNLIEKGLAPPMRKEKVNEFLQSWLWFSLLAQVLHREVRRTDFHRQHDHTLSTKELTNYISEWGEQTKKAAENEHSYHHMTTSNYVRASLSLEKARRFVSKHCAHDRMDRDDRSRLQHGCICPYEDCTVDKRVDVTLALSLTILGETLQLKRPDIPSGFKGRSQFYNEPNTRETYWGHSTHCRDLLQGNGWCPFEIRRMEATLIRVTNAYLVSRMKPPKPTIDHAICTTLECNAEKPFRTALHMPGCDKNCKTESLNEDEMVKWISNGKTPLVILKDATGMEKRASDLKKEKNITFVAVSHCWSDGITETGKDARGGNNRCLHRCQLEKIQNTCDRLFKGKGLDV